MTARHVRVLTALVAAIALHALLLSWPLPASRQLALLNNGLLHIDLLKAPEPATMRPNSPSMPMQRVQVKQQQKKVMSAKKLQHKHRPPVADTVATAQKPIPKPKPASQPTGIKPALAARLQVQATTKLAHADSVHREEQRPDSRGATSEARLPATLASGAQAMLLANIHYPPQARRHGWQGKGEFQLAVVSQNIRNITMLVSTGHAILDRAVRRGLAGIKHVPVADGQYRLPVEFRLQ